MNFITLKTALGATLTLLAASAAWGNGESKHEEGEMAALQRLVDENTRFAQTQYQRLAAFVNEGEGLPRSFENGEVALTEPRKWTSGFFPGSLWMLYQLSGDECWKEEAARLTDRLEPVSRYKGTHDLGFMLFNSYGKAFELTGEERYRSILLRGADNLAGRFSDSVGCIKSWDWGKDRFSFPVIIDNMMNLKYLAWSASQSPERRRHLAILVAHAESTYRNDFRTDGSVWHVVDYDPETGGIERKMTYQGYNDDSRWARGQAWAVYGFADCARATGLERYRERARETAQLCLELNRRCKDGIPPWDYDVPDAESAPRDVSAAAILSSALLELARYEPDPTRSEPFEAAVRIVETLSRAPYRSDDGANGGFLLQHSTGNLPKGDEIDVPIIYADYYFLEANLRLRDLIAENANGKDQLK